ncbi:MAG: hypothetical protein CTY12_00650 [Methylotenera sp.]|nr:MAG: hypothetical protein CTY12_00650 [Methylotenera sp.]
MQTVSSNVTGSSVDLAGVVDMLDQDIDLIGTDSDDGVALEIIAAKNEIKDEPKTDNVTETETPAEPKGPTKMDGARAIFVSNFGKPGVARKDVIKLFEGLGCSKACAATYYQNLTKAVKDGKLIVDSNDNDSHDESETETV